MSVRSEAKKDAYELAAAEMAFGQGAGTRRKLIKISVQHKINTIPGYAALLDEELGNQNMAKHAKKAKSSRRQKDVAKKVERNVRGLASGNRQNLTGGVAVASAIVYVMHQTGTDVIVKDRAVKEYRKAKAWTTMKYRMHKAKTASTHRGGN